MSKQQVKMEEKSFPFLFHYYRAEVYRETVWRNRLDTTTNWAIVVTAATLSFAFSGVGTAHIIIIINYIIVGLLLYVESRRFRYYALLRERTKMMEKHILGPLFSNKISGQQSEKWLSDIARSLQSPKINMSRIESISWRLRRNYIFILAFLYMIWLYRILTFPRQENLTGGIYSNASIDFIPGYFVFTAMTLSIITLIFVALYVPKKYGKDDLP